jgi:hypothetical protein
MYTNFSILFFKYLINTFFPYIKAFFDFYKISFNVARWQARHVMQKRRSEAEQHFA